MMKNLNRINKATAVTGLATMVFASCASPSKTPKETNNMQITKVEKIEKTNDMDNQYLILSNEQRSAVDCSNAFALNLMRTQTGMDSKVISPLSVAYLMGMLANGANGDTQKEIMAALGMKDMSLQTLNEAYEAIIKTASHLDQQTTINIANCIAANKNVSLKADYAKAMGDMYKADVASLDFMSPKALQHINGWCAKQTEGMIPKIVDNLDPNTTAVLMNAIYFNGTWKKEFDKSETKEENFRGYTRDIKRVQMMHNEVKLQYAERDGFAAVNLPYGNEAYMMTVILPNEGKSTTDIFNSLDTKQLDELRRGMENCIVDLKLPRFSTTTNTNLNGPIAQLGAPSIFQAGKADFSNMSNTSMALSAMFQKAKIEVTEEGTKAAAVTAGIMMTSMIHSKPRHVNFHANRPFIYMITERNSGAILFMGQYVGE